MQQIDAVLNQAVESGDIPGVVAMVATDSGPVYAGAFGTRRLDAGPAMTTDTVFRIASMTKAVASVAAMQLYEQGKFGLDQPLGEIIPALAQLEVLDGFDAAGQPQLRPAKRPVTARRLLTHTAGFGYEIWNPGLGQYQTATGKPGIGSGKKAALHMPLVRDPGERWEYGINTDWVGQLVEAVSGQTLGDYLAQHVFEPLGMTDTGFARSAEQAARTVSVHQRGEDGTLAPTELELVTPDAEYQSGGHGLSSTAADYLAFVQMLLKGGSHNGQQILKPETVALMSENHIGDLAAGDMTTAVRPLSNDVKFSPGVVHKHGLGFLINTSALPGARAAGSLSWAGLFNSYYWIDPAKRVTGVIMMQILPFFDVKAIPVYERFEHATYQALGLLEA
jgi:CubicO group peptidase (beta-lactamase class C family)